MCEPHSLKHHRRVGKTAIVCLLLVLATAATPGCYIPGGGWTLRSGLDFRTYRRPAVFTELVDTRWDEYNRVALQNTMPQGQHPQWGGSYVDPVSGVADCPPYTDPASQAPGYPGPQDLNSTGSPPSAPGVNEKQLAPPESPVDESGLPRSSMPRMQTDPDLPHVPAPGDGPSAEREDNRPSQSGKSKRVSSSRDKGPQLVPSSSLDDDAAPTESAAPWSDLRDADSASWDIRQSDSPATAESSVAESPIALDESEEPELDSNDARRRATLLNGQVDEEELDEIPMPTSQRKTLRARFFGERVYPASAPEKGQTVRATKPHHPKRKAGGTSTFESAIPKPQGGEPGRAKQPAANSSRLGAKGVWFRSPQRLWLGK